MYIYTSIEKLILSSFRRLIPTTSSSSTVGDIIWQDIWFIRICQVIWTQNYYWNSPIQKNRHRSCQNLVESIWEICRSFSEKSKWKKRSRTPVSFWNLWCFNFFYPHPFCSFLIIITKRSGSQKTFARKSARRQWLHNIQEKMKKKIKKKGQVSARSWMKNFGFPPFFIRQKRHTRKKRSRS